MQAEIEKLLKENKELKKQIKSSAGSPAARSPEDLQKQAETLMKAIVKNIEGQMIYKKGMKGAFPPVLNPHTTSVNVMIVA